MSETYTGERVRNHNYLIPSLFSLPNHPKGEIGIEIETIGKRLPGEFQKTKLWGYHPDGSVKARPGEGTAEYVLLQPIGRAKIEQALDELIEEFKEAKADVAEGRLSNSVHIHINAQALTMQQVYTWLALYFIFEEQLVRWCGEDRVGNLFCLRARDAEGLIRALARAAKDDRWDMFRGDHSLNYRYAACNTTALGKFGSLEFRALRGTAKKDVILQWINTLLAIKDKSLEYKNPVEVMADFSRRSPMGMARHIMPIEMCQFMFQQADFQDSLWEGARLSQDFAFATEWQGKTLTKGEQPRPRAKKAEIDFAAYANMVNHTTVIVDDGLPATPQGQGVHPTSWASIAFGNTPDAPAPAPPVSASIAFRRNFKVWKTPESVSYKKVSPHTPPSQIKHIRINEGVVDLCKENNWKIGWKTEAGVEYLAIITQLGSVMQWIRPHQVTNVNL